MSPRVRRFTGLLSLALLAPLLGAAPAAWPPATDIAPDTAVRSGRLDNGLRYAVLENHEPRDRASVRLLVGVGSLDETDDERGLAHYLEHMAFNGTRNFPADTLVEWFQRNGMSFGGDSNAATGFETTTYMLELPHGSQAALKEGLAVLRDFADGMLIEESEVEKERGIIFAEKRSRDSVEFRTAMAEFEFILPGTLPPRRFPIGVTETLTAADAGRLRAFFERWYRPDNMVLVVVGEMDGPAIEAMIKESFASLAKPSEPLRRTSPGTVSAIAEPAAELHRETEAATVSVSLQIVSPWEREPDSIAARVRDLPLDVANAILSRRLSELTKKDNAPFTVGAAGSSEAFDFARIASIELTGPPDRWRDALTLAEQEVRRALTHGFSPVELREITANIINSLEEATRSAATRRSSGLASGLVNAVHRDRVFTTPETDLALFRPAVQALTVDACLAALRTAWSASAPRIFVSGKLAATDTAADALAVVRVSRASPVEAPAAPADEPFAYTHVGPPGTVTSRLHVEDLDLWLVQFANGVRLNLKRTDFRANSISLRARLGGGRLELPRERTELSALASTFLTEGGLGRHSKDEMRRLLAGRSVSLGFSVDDDAFTFNGGTSPKDLELTLQVLCAYLTDPGWRADSLNLIRTSVRQGYERMQRLPGGVAQMHIPRLLASGDPRFGMPPLDALLAITPDDVRDVLTPAFAADDMELAIVGDIDIDATIQLAAATVGALPPRRAPQAFADGRMVSYPVSAPRETFTVETEIPKALVLVYWPTDDNSDVQRTRRLSLLAAVMDDRLRKVVREELAAAYSPSASSDPSDTYTGYGLFSVSVEVDPPQAALIRDTIVRIAEEMRTDGISQDELDRTREPVLTAIRESVRQNGYWLNAVLSKAQARPEYLDYARSREADISSVTKADLDALAATYLDANRAAQFIITPAAQ